MAGKRSITSVGATSVGTAFWFLVQSSKNRLVFCRGLTVLSVKRNGQAALYGAGAAEDAAWVQHSMWQMPPDVLALVRRSVY